MIEWCLLMYCKNCGNKLNDNAVFCSKCGVKNEADVIQQSISNNKNSVANFKINFLLSNTTVLKMFNLNMLLLSLAVFSAILRSVEDSQLDSQASSGWTLIFSPVIISICVFPHLIGAYLSTINLKRKSYTLLIFIFIISIICLIIVFTGPLDVHNHIWWICLISSIILCMLILLKLILKKLE